jgi:acyl-CoA hydrolase
MGVADTNTAGFVHGGTILRLCDEAAGLAATKHSRLLSVTAGVDRVTFNTRIELGDLVSFKSTVNAAWRTSMEVGVRVEAEHPHTGEARHAATAYFTMVAVDEDGRPTPVPPLGTETADERRREAEAQARRRNRLAERDELRTAREA